MTTPLETYLKRAAECRREAAHTNLPSVKSNVSVPHSLGRIWPNVHSWRRNTARRRLSVDLMRPAAAPKPREVRGTSGCADEPMRRTARWRMSAMGRKQRLGEEWPFSAGDASAQRANPMFQSSSIRRSSTESFEYFARLAAWRSRSTSKRESG